MCCCKHKIEFLCQVVTFLISYHICVLFGTVVGHGRREEEGEEEGEEDAVNNTPYCLLKGTIIRPLYMWTM